MNSNRQLANFYLLYPLLPLEQNLLRQLIPDSELIMAFVPPFSLPHAHLTGKLGASSNRYSPSRLPVTFPRRASFIASTNDVLSPTPLPRVKFPSLRPDAFRHPVDIRATRVLQSFIGLEAILRSLLRLAEQTFFFENIAMGVKVSEKQYPSIHAMLVEACDVLDLQVPQLYIRQNPVPNAYTLAVQGDKSFVVIHSSLVDLLTPAELQAVIAHELGHLKSEHGVWVTMANLLLLLSSSTLGGTLGRGLYETLNSQLLAWQRSAELTCDRAMLLVLQDTRVAMSALMKLTGGVAKYAQEMDVDEFLAQADQYDKETQTWMGRRVSRAMTNGLTHPLPVMRARELKRWSESNHFRSLIRSGRPLSSALQSNIQSES